MKAEFTLSINQVSFRFKRIYHPELPLTYHVHFDDWHQHTVFRMRQDEAGNWAILPMHLPGYVMNAEDRFSEAIQRNEGG